MKTKCKISILTVLLFCLLFSTQVFAKDGSAIPAEGFSTTLGTNPYVDPSWFGKQLILSSSSKKWSIPLSDFGSMPMQLANQNGVAVAVFTDSSLLDAYIQQINNELTVLPTVGGENVFDRASGTYQKAPAGYVSQIRQEFSNLLLQTLSTQFMSDLKPNDIRIDLNDGYLVCFAPGNTPIVAGACTTSFKGSSSNRINNITVAAGNLDGLVLQPGQVLSVSDAIKPRTIANGYKEAGTYLNGTTVPGIGGGICQVSSTVYNATMNAGLTALERHPHSMPVHYLPLGLDAAISAGSKDLKVRNDYDLPVTLHAEVSGYNLTISVVANSALLNGTTRKLWSQGAGHNLAKTYLSTYDASGAEINRVLLNTSRYSDPKPKEVAEED